MLDARLDDFDEQARFIVTLAGLLSTLDRAAALLEIPAPNSDASVDDDVLNLALGLLSFRQRLRMTLADQTATPEELPNVSREPVDTSWLR
jgi:hypothetical protein